MHCKRQLWTAEEDEIKHEAAMLRVFLLLLCSAMDPLAAATHDIASVRGVVELRTLLRMLERYVSIGLALLYNLEIEYIALSVRENPYVDEGLLQSSP